MTSSSATPHSRTLGPGNGEKRVNETSSNFHVLVNYDRLYIGGGNAQALAGRLDPSVTILGNIAGILGGIKLWDLSDG